MAASETAAAPIPDRRLVEAEDAGLERLFFELTTSGTSAPSQQTDPSYSELTGATA